VGEKKAFLYFETPNILAESLNSLNLIKKNNGRKAMSSIGHVNTSYWDWFVNEKYFLTRTNDIFL